jgi:hypothetical protein
MDISIANRIMTKNLYSGMAWIFCITAKMPKRGLNGPVAQVADKWVHIK